MENMDLETIKEKYAEYIAGLSEEDKAKVDSCKTPEELLKLAESSHAPLPDDILEAVAGGGGKFDEVRCPRPDCRSTDVHTDTATGLYVCDVCGYKFER